VLDGSTPNTSFYPPVVLADVTPEMSIFHTEVFGPVLTATRFGSVDEAIALANHSAYGLAGSVWTSDITTALRVARSVRTGWIEVNTSLDGRPQLPFGGYKTSGNGREKGLQGLLEFTETKTIGIRTAPREPFFG
jgi:acyl-CoA reductase-like NAD-dependent aldehyde dehydrogenase